LQNEALARATGEAADAVLKAQAAGTQTAASIAEIGKCINEEQVLLRQRIRVLEVKQVPICNSVILLNLQRRE